MKFRFRETLEVKVRQEVDAPLVLDAGLGGRIEVWRKFRPATRLLDDDVTRWVDVQKMVVKRGFSANGDELALAGARTQASGAGCDVEIAAVRAGDVDAWTFAFAVFGPDASRRDSVFATWRALAAEPTPHGSLQRLSDR